MRTALLKLNDVISRIIDEERWQRSKESATALATRTCGNGNKSDNKTKRCTHCKCIGYKDLECWQLHSEKRLERSSDSNKKPNEDTKKREEQLIGLIAHMHSIDELTWIFDSSASHYVYVVRCSLFSPFRRRSRRMPFT
jgi:hypothetical protein